MAFTRRTEEPISPSSLAEPPPHFFKVILSATLEEKKLRIPEMFVRKFGDELSDVATMREPNGRVWHVKLIKDGKMIWFHDGWHDFVKYHSIGHGYFLLFKYEKKSKFHVLIFDKSACEVQYPHHCEEPENDEQNSVQRKEMENDNSGETNVFDKFPVHYSRSKRCKIEEVEKVDESDVVGDVSDLREGAYKFVTHSSDEKKETTCDKHEFLALLKDLGITVVARGFQNISAEARERAINTARFLKPKNPCFMVILQSRKIEKYSLYLPINFASKYLSRDAKVITLQVSDGREWQVQFDWRENGSGDLRKGWTEFAKENNLEEGDMCLFEVIRTKDILLKVSIFHSV